MAHVRSTRAAPAPRTALTAADLAAVDRRLAATDALLERAYPGDDGSRQPVHTVYVPADRYGAGLPGEWGAAALAAAESTGGLEALAERVGVERSLVDVVVPAVRDKLEREPIEDLRLDFEDGYGDRGDEVEDSDAWRLAERVAAAVAAGLAPPFIGVRVKSFEAPTRARGIRTLDLFVSTLVARGELPGGLVLTLPKVSTVAQVEAMAEVAAALERAHGLPDGRLRFEVQVETPQLVLGPDGDSPLAQLPTAVPGRISALHYGTYDYSASLQISPANQSMEHPVADHAKEVMRLAAAGTGIRLSDGSTNILPLGDRADEAWRLHARLVRRSLDRGFYQGWDLHPHQLPTRFIATYAFFREGYAEASGRLRGYLGGAAGAAGAVLDEPATARALADFVLRGVECGAIAEAEVVDDVGIDRRALSAIAHPRLANG
ncbi:citrate lyase beta subunit [Agromyces hippuratus]|uniref:Citrate lyase beta subunit n=1 Tax=Agromyces hippuratus TaxID=286438 RepID=A0A852WT48_9MICO|nr:aldolase [Agromyces hippuratus]NYG20728.1 citrate lyase beta subunit [Agromyces hippuratus]